MRLREELPGIATAIKPTRSSPSRITRDVLLPNSRSSAVSRIRLAVCAREFCRHRPTMVPGTSFRRLSKRPKGWNLWHFQGRDDDSEPFRDLWDVTLVKGAQAGDWELIVL